MKTVLSTKKGSVHSDWTLMKAWFNNDGTFQLCFADKLSDDSIQFTLENEEAERLFERLTPKQIAATN